MIDRKYERIITRNHNKERVGEGQVVKSFPNFPSLKAEHKEAREASIRVGTPSELQPWHLIKTDSGLMICYPEEWIELTAPIRPWDLRVIEDEGIDVIDKADSLVIATVVACTPEFIEELRLLCRKGLEH